MAGTLTTSKAGARFAPRPTSRQDRLHEVACGGRVEIVSLTSVDEAQLSMSHPRSRSLGPNWMSEILFPERAHLNVVRLSDRKSLNGNPRGGSPLGGRRLRKEKVLACGRVRMGAVPRGMPVIEVFRRMGKNPSAFSPENRREGNCKICNREGKGEGGREEGGTEKSDFKRNKEEGLGKGRRKKGKGLKNSLKRNKDGHRVLKLDQGLIIVMKKQRRREKRIQESKGKGETKEEKLRGEKEGEEERRKKEGGKREGKKRGGRRTRGRRGKLENKKKMENKHNKHKNREF
ncbi:hypothetical protein NDU88_007544 [Pleurodeles waltl]|uniref:Uncharacterized protein n=1 Tax=Pleurodeles waltl TaxID=8319 RepID=A0AAV7N3Z9_PLEWA|nr:hypothetical protein NDU88_007544 [Pleurodeles waltl]